MRFAAASAAEAVTVETNELGRVLDKEAIDLPLGTTGSADWLQLTCLDRLWMAR